MRREQYETCQNNENAVCDEILYFNYLEVTPRVKIKRLPTSFAARAAQP